MTKQSTNSDKQKEFLLNLEREQMRKIEEENPEGYRDDLLWKASKELLMQHESETPSHMEASEQKGSQYDVYLPMMQKNEGPKGHL